MRTYQETLNRDRDFLAKELSEALLIIDSCRSLLQELVQVDLVHEFQDIVVDAAKEKAW
jgi:hypothetical protein